MTYLLRPPTVREAPEGSGPLFGRVGVYRGVTLLVTDGVAVEARYPTQDEVAAADAAYIGGHEYLLTDEQAAPLLAAGYDCTKVHVYIDQYESRY